MQRIHPVTMPRNQESFVDSTTGLDSGMRRNGGMESGLDSRLTQECRGQGNLGLDSLFALEW